MSFTPPSLARSLVASLLIAAGATACATAGTLPRSDEGSATVEVANQAFLDVNVYVIRAGQRMRLGTVSGSSTRTFVVPRTLVGTGAQVRFLADFIGSNRAPVSEEMVIWAGDRVQLTIPSG